MLPCPGALALIAREAVQRDADRPLRAGWAEPRVDLIKWSGSGGDRQRRGHALCQPIVVKDCSQGLFSIRFGEVIAGEQIDEVKVGRVGQRPATQPPERKNDEFAVGNAAMGSRKFLDRRPCEHDDRSLGDTRIAGRHVERIADAGDDLGA